MSFNMFAYRVAAEAVSAQLEAALRDIEMLPPGGVRNLVANHITAALELARNAAALCPKPDPVPSPPDRSMGSVGPW